MSQVSDDEIKYYVALLNTAFSKLALSHSLETADNNILLKVASSVEASDGVDALFLVGKDRKLCKALFVITGITSPSAAFSFCRSKMEKAGLLNVYREIQKVEFKEEFYDYYLRLNAGHLKTLHTRTQVLRLAVDGMLLGQYSLSLVEAWKEAYSDELKKQCSVELVLEWCESSKKKLLQTLDPKSRKTFFKHDFYICSRMKPKSYLQKVTELIEQSKQSFNSLSQYDQEFVSTWISEENTGSTYISIFDI